MKKGWSAGVLAVLAGLAIVWNPSTSLHAQNGASTYVLLTAPGQSRAVAAAVSRAGGSIVADYAFGVAVASSTRSDFAARITSEPSVQQVAADVRIPAVRPAQRAQASMSEVQAALEGPSAAGVNTEPFFGLQWPLVQIRANQTAAAGHLGAGARVAVLDTGVIGNHIDIAPNYNAGLSRSFVPHEPTPEPVDPTQFSHGTHVAGIIAAAVNNRGTQGVAPQAELVSVKVLDSVTGAGSFAWAIAGIAYAASIRADVINMSLGATFDRADVGGLGPLVAALNRAVNHATSAGSLVVSAAGNEAVDLNSSLWSLPAQSGNGMAVSATGPIGLTNFDRLASYSNYGQSVISVAAPGGDFTLYPNGSWFLDMVLAPSARVVNPNATVSHQYSFSAGTSMAAPHVSGVAALIVGTYGRMSPAKLRSRIQQGAVDILKTGADPESGHGRLDAVGALE